jgi:hypothetical protein
MSTKKLNKDPVLPVKTPLQRQVNAGLPGGRYVLKDGKAVLATELPTPPLTDSKEK